MASAHYENSLLYDTGPSWVQFSIWHSPIKRTAYYMKQVHHEYGLIYDTGPLREQIII